ncbi:MAG: hypothetical protein JRF57_15340 [Deltaproteobacteria bacterium]|nr:hypothetical protein [Deltaproteobacteria bacterium]
MEILDSNDFRKGAIHHPYTAYLILSNPTLNPRQRSSQEGVLQGDVPSPINPPKGCRFHPRCPFFKEICRQKDPPLLETDTDHFVKCHFPDRVERKLQHLLKRKLEMYRICFD